MSSAYMIAVTPGQDGYREISKFPNAHALYTPVWNPLACQYLNLAPYAFLEHFDDLWALAYNPAVAKHHRAVLMMTFDRAYIMRADYQEAALDVRAFLKDFPSDYWDHWPQIERLFKSAPTSEALAFYASLARNFYEGELLDEDEGTHASIVWENFENIYEVVNSVSQLPVLDGSR